MSLVSGQKLTKRLREASFAAMLRQEVAWFDQSENSPGQDQLENSDGQDQSVNSTGQDLQQNSLSQNQSENCTGQD